MSVMSESRRSQSSITLSTISRLTSFATYNEEQKFSEWRETFFFPLFTEISRFGHIPPFIYVIQFIILFVQEIGVTMWCGSLSIDNEKGSILDIVYCFTDWQITRRSNINECLPQFIVGFSLFIITNLFLIFVSLYYQSKRTFNRWHLIILRFLLYPLLGILLPLYGSFVGRSFYEITKFKSTATSVALFTVSIPVFLISIFEYKYVIQFSTNTPVIDRSLFGAWDDQIVFFTVFSISMGSTLSTLLEVFPKWLRVAALLGYMLLLFYRIYLLYFIPMLRFLMNSIFLSVCLMGITNCVFSFIHVFTDLVPEFVYPSASILFFLIFMFICYRWYDGKKIRCLNALSYSSISDSEKPEDSEKRAHFDTLIFTSVNDAITFMRVGVSFQSDTILDFSFLRYLMENYAETAILFEVAKVASFFPAELHFLSYCLSIVSKAQEMTLAQEFLVSQMRRIHVVRQSSVSADASSQLGVLQKMSRDTISQVRGFWGEILNAKTDISFASLHYLRKVTLKTDSAFLDACDRFPNNVSIMNEYCRFQIEAMGDFLGAISSGKKMLLLDQGKNLTIDHAFRSLVNVYPNYLLNGIFNIHGNFVQKGLLAEASSSSVSSSNSSQEDFEEKYEEIISQLYTHGKLRVALQTRMKLTRLKGLNLALMCSIIQLLSCVIVYLLIIFVLPLTTDNALRIIECCNDISKVTLKIQYISCIAGIQAAINERSFGGINILKSLLGLTSSDMKQGPSLFNEPYKAIHNTASELQKSFGISTRSLMSTMNNVIEDIPTFSEENTQFIRNKNQSQDLTMRSSVAFFCYDAETLASNAIIDLNSEATKKVAAELMMNTNSITTTLQTFQISVNKQGDKSIRDQKNMIRAIAIIVVTTAFVLFISFRIYNNVLIFRQAKQCSDLLRKVNPALIRESYAPIALKGQKEAIRGNNVHSAHEMNVLMVIYLLVIVLSIILTVALAITSCLFFSEGLNIAESVFNWFSYGNIRFSSILGALVTVCAQSTGVVSTSEAGQILDAKIKTLLVSQQEIDVTLMGIDTRFDEFYFSKHCKEDRTTANYADYMACLSLDNKINIAAASILNLVDVNSTKNLNDQNFASLIYLVDMYLVEELAELQDLMVDYSVTHFELASSRTLSIIIAGLVVCCLVFLLEQFFIRTFQQSVDAIKQLVLMLPPVSVATSTFLMDFINNGIRNEDDEVALSASESILSATSTAAVLLDQNQIIQAVNKAVNDTTGFTPDQILGQTISWLIPPPFIDHIPKATRPKDLQSFTPEMKPLSSSLKSPEKKKSPLLSLLSSSSSSSFSSSKSSTSVSNDKFYTCLNEMKNSEDEQTDPTAVLTVKCLTENGCIIPMRTTILFLRDRTNGENHQYVLLLRDLSKETKMLKVIQETKKRTNRLLKSLVPKSIVGSLTSTQLSSSSPDKPLTSEYATVIMIEVSGLTEYVHTLSPQQLMQNLKTVYDGFEKTAIGFPAVSILKMNAEIFVACCGLFSFFDDKKEQAIQAVTYSNRMIEEIETINEELDIDLHLRIGINAGGPMIGSMLNPMMPSFEILGSFINLATKMQIEGEVGIVQVGEAIVPYLDPDIFDVQKGLPLAGTAGSIDYIYVVRLLTH